jgi:osmotically-inducible protein OsmY
METDRDTTRLRSEVEAALFTELRIDDLEIAVSIEDGTAVLRGTVGSLGAKLAAGRAARRVRGVRRVENALDVRLLGGRRTDDAELRGGVLSALISDAAVPPTVDAIVDNGVVVLTGTVGSQHERSAAESIARRQLGVVDVENRLTVERRSA